MLVCYPEEKWKVSVGCAQMGNCKQCTMFMYRLSHFCVNYAKLFTVKMMMPGSGPEIPELGPTLHPTHPHSESVVTLAKSLAFHQK